MQGGIALQRVVFSSVPFLFFCSGAFFLSVKMISERCFSTVVAGYSLFFIFLFLMFSSKVISEEFALRSLKCSPLMKPFVMPGG